MPKRVSLKGKGADIFFGDFTPTQIDDTAPVPSQQVATSATPEITPTALAIASEQESMQARKHASMQEGTPKRQRAPNRSSAPSPNPSPLTVEVLNAISQQLAERATVTNAFRYTADELARLEDMHYELGRHHGVKLSKQDIARLGLNAVLWDYKTRGDESFVSQYVRRRKRP